MRGDRLQLGRDGRWKYRLEAIGDHFATGKVLEIGVLYGHGPRK